MDDMNALVRKYLGTISEKNFARLRDMLADDITSAGPAIEIEGAQAYVDAVRRLAPVLVRNEIRRIFVDGAEACAIYDFVTDTAAGAVRSVEWIKFDGSKIRSSELVFDQQMWAAVREELARRAPVSQ
jgi:hypothetical protein